MMIERIALGALSLLGFLISVYFALTFHAQSTFLDRHLPRFCRIDSATCSTILGTPQASVFGIPNFDLGILFYTALLGSTILPGLWKQLHLMLFAGSSIAVATGFYLTYVLVFRLHVKCTLCFMSHAANFLIFIVLLITL